MRSPITTHILDTSIGKPAEGVEVILAQQSNENWQELARKKTNEDGRVEDLLDSNQKLETGIYRLKFLIQEYFQRENRSCFYPFVSICFEVKNSEQHYHVPLLLNGFGYSTYRGS